MVFLAAFIWAPKHGILASRRKARMAHGSAGTAT
jgi:hypothetical protein